MSTDVTLLVAVPGPGEAPLVSGLERVRGVVVVRRCADLTELVAAARAGHGRAAVVSAELRRLDRSALADLAAAGVAVVGLAGVAGPGAGGEVGEGADGSPAGTAGAGGRLRALGVAHVVPADATPEQVARAVQAAVAALEAERAADGGHDRAVGSPRSIAAPAVPAGGATPVAPVPSSPVGAPPGLLVAVWGPAGAPGRTTVATTLATELAQLLPAPAGAGGRWPVLLADADTHAAATAQVLGLLDEAPGIAAACRAAEAGAVASADLARLAPVVLPGLRVLTGLPRPERWAELRAAALEHVWEAARAFAAVTVVDCGPSLERDEELLFDTGAPRRNAAALTTLAAADLVLVVGAADPVGLQRLVRALPDVAAVAPTARRVVVVTRLRASAVGPSPRRRVLEALSRYAGVHEPVLVPDDRPACDAALLAGRTLTEAAPASPARRALARLAADLVADLPGADPSGNGSLPGGAGATDGTADDEAGGADGADGVVDGGARRGRRRRAAADGAGRWSRMPRLGRRSRTGR